MAKKTNAFVIAIGIVFVFVILNQSTCISLVDIRGNWKIDWNCSYLTNNPVVTFHVFFSGNRDSGSAECHDYPWNDEGGRASGRYSVDGSTVKFDMSYPFHQEFFEGQVNRHGDYMSGRATTVRYDGAVIDLGTWSGWLIN